MANSVLSHQSQELPTRQSSRDIVFLWLFFLIATSISSVFSSVASTIDITMVFCMFSTLISIVLSFRITTIIGTLYTLWVAAATIFMAFLSSSSDDRSFWPVLLAFGPLILAAVASVVVFVTLSAPYVLYRCSSGRFIMRLPRYRKTNRHNQAKLCALCRNVLGNSSLLSGSWAVFVKTEERHPFYSSMDEMQRSWQGCSLCEALLSQNAEAGRDESHESRSPMDGSASSAPALRSPSTLEKGRLEIRIRLGESSSFQQWFGLQFTISLQAPDTNKFREFDIVEGLLAGAPEKHGFTGADAVMNKISKWISDCDCGHEACRPLNIQTNFLPTRLLDVGKEMSPQLRIVLGIDVKTTLSDKYFALSHCWGGDIAFKLTTSNLRSLQDCIDINDLSKNFQDAISITRRLGIRYLWIDSLCIIQDSLDDWAVESHAMREVYENATCVISATASNSSNGGCYRAHSSPSEIWSLMATRRTHYFPSAQIPSTKSLFDTRVEPAPLTKRCWAFQERLLSRRVVHFCSDVVLFECNTMQASEFNSKGSRYEKLPYMVHNGKIMDWFDDTIRNWFLSFVGYTRDNFVDLFASRGIRGALDVLKSLGPASELTLREKLEFNQRWYKLVSAYTEGALTIPTDKLVAIAGIADLVEGKVKSPYAAGLWTSVFVELGLLWRVKHPEMRNPIYCAPSWSWASATGAVDLLLHMDFANTVVEGFVSNIQVDQILVSYKGKVSIDTSSLVDDGFLEITGPIADVLLSKSEPQRLQFAHDINPIQKALDFFPDWKLETCVSSTEPPFVLEVENRVLAVRVLTTPFVGSEVRVYGIVVKLEGEKNSLLECKRLGVFCTNIDRSSDGSPLSLRQWPSRTIRIV